MVKQGWLGFTDQLIDAMRVSEENVGTDDRIDFQIFCICSEALEALSSHFKQTGSWGVEFDDQFEVMEALRDVFDGQYDQALFEELVDSAENIDGVNQWREKARKGRERPGPVNSSLALGILSLNEDDFLQNIDSHIKTVKEAIIKKVEIERGWVDYERTKGIELLKIDKMYDGWGKEGKNSIDDTRDVIVSLMKISNQAQDWIKVLDDNSEAHVHPDDVKNNLNHLKWLSSLCSAQQIRLSVEVYLLLKLQKMRCTHHFVEDEVSGDLVNFYGVKDTVDIGVSFLSYLRAREHDSEFELSVYAQGKDVESEDDTKLRLNGYSYSPVRKFIDWRALQDNDAKYAKLVIACLEEGYDPVRVALYNIQCWLLEIQNEDGGWGKTTGAPSELEFTSRVLYLLGDCSKIPREDRGDSQPFNPPAKPFIMSNPLVSPEGEGDMKEPLKKAALYVITHEQRLQTGGWGRQNELTVIDSELTARIVGGLSYAIEDHKPPLFMDDLLRICARSAVSEAFRERFAPKLNRVQFEINDDAEDLEIKYRVEKCGQQGLSLRNNKSPGYTSTMNDAINEIIEIGEARPVDSPAARSLAVSTYRPSDTETVEMLSMQAKEAGKKLYGFVNFIDEAYAHGQALVLVTNRNDIPWEMMYHKKTSIHAKSDAGIHQSWGYLGLDMQIGRKIPVSSELSKSTAGTVEFRNKITDGKLTVLLVAPSPDDLDETIKECEMIEKSIRRELLKNRDSSEPEFHTLFGPQATKEEICRTLRQEPIDIFHFSGHGYNDENDKQRMTTNLICYRPEPSAKPPSRSELIDPDDLSKALQGPGGPPSLVYLNACNAGKITDNHEKTLITHCLQAGVPAVIAMTFEIQDDVAQKMGIHIYKSYVIERETIGTSCLQARREIHKDTNEITLWGPLALFGDPTARFNE